MQDQVRSQRQDLLVHWGGKSAVDTHQSPLGMAHAGHQFDIDTAQVRVGGGFREEERHLADGYRGNNKVEISPIPTPFCVCLTTNHSPVSCEGA